MSETIETKIKYLNSLLAYLSKQELINDRLIYDLCNKIKALKTR